MVVAHSVTERPLLPIGPAGAWVTPPDRLREFLERRGEWLRGSVASCLEERNGSGRALLLTFDDGYRDFLLEALPVLEATETPCILFVVTDLFEPGRAPFEHRLAALVAALDRVRIPGVGEVQTGSVAEKDRVYRDLYAMWRSHTPDSRNEALLALAETNRIAPKAPDEFLSWDELRELDRHPLVTIGSHTRRHPLLTSLATPEAREEIAGSKAILEEELGHSVDCFSYPYGAHSFRLRRAVRDVGFRYAFTTGARRVPRRLRPFAIPRYEIHHPDLD